VSRVDIEVNRVTNEAGPGAGKPDYSDRVDLLRSRAEMLTGKDKVLMQMYLNGSSFSEMARLRGVGEATITRRVRKLTRRLLCGEYMMCLRSRRFLSGLEQTIAKDYFLEGRSQEAIAQKVGITVYQVRKTLRRLRALFKGKGIPNMSGTLFGEKSATRNVRRKGHDANL